MCFARRADWETDSPTTEKQLGPRPAWDTCFAEPIDLPNGVKLGLLRDAIVHLVNTVPSSERGTPVIVTAAELITSAAERGGPIEFARIATLRALSRQPARRTKISGRHASACPTTIFKPSAPTNRIYANR
jgi:hypothetical protein